MFGDFVDISSRPRITPIRLGKPEFGWSDESSSFGPLGTNDMRLSLSSHVVRLCLFPRLALFGFVILLPGFSLLSSRSMLTIFIRHVCAGGEVKGCDGLCVPAREDWATRHASPSHCWVK